MYTSLWNFNLRTISLEEGARLQLTINSSKSVYLEENVGDV